MERWSRQTILPELGREGQQRLHDARVLCIGTGALGSPATLYLAAAGVGTLVICDPDHVEKTNLQRQIIHGESQCGNLKVQSAAERLRELNPDIRLELHACRFTPENAMALTNGCHVIVDGSDNFPTRFLCNDVAFFRKIPLVHAAIQRFEGQMTVFAPHLGGPCYRCLLPEMPAPGSVPGCAEAGVIGALPGIMGSLQAMETLKLLAGMGSPAIGKMLFYDALHCNMRQIILRADPRCHLCGPNATITSHCNPETMHSEMCSQHGIPSITVEEFYRLRQKSNTFLLIDVREAAEHERMSIPDSILVPLASLSAQWEKWSPENEIFVHCQAGSRSARAAQMLIERGFLRVTNITGGMDAWMRAGLPTHGRGDG